jgi:hypothetical protein
MEEKVKCCHLAAAHSSDDCVITRKVECQTPHVRQEFRNRMVSLAAGSAEEHTVDKVYPGKIAEKTRAQGE